MCSQLALLGETLAIMTVRDSPTNESRSTSVSFEPLEMDAIEPHSGTLEWNTAHCKPVKDTEIPADFV